MPSGRRVSSALLVSAGIFCSRLFGLLRERAFAYYLGNSMQAGAFRAALRIPNILQNLFGEGSLSASFIPAYVRLLAQNDPQKATRLASTIATMLLLLVLVLTSAGVLAAGPLTDLLAPGFSPEARLLTERLLRIIFPGIGLLVLSALCLGVQNSHRKFFLSYAAPVAWNVMIIAMLVLSGSVLAGGAGSPDRLAVAAAWGTLLGSLLQLLVQVPVTLRLLGPFRLSLEVRDPHVRAVVGNFLPALVSRGVVQISAYIDQILSSFLGARIVSAMGYAQTLYLLPFSLIASSLAAAELPEMSQVSGPGEAHAAELAARLRLSFSRLDFLVVPSAAAFLGLGGVVTAAVYQTGSFGGADVRMVWAMLGASALGLPASAKSRMMVSAFWACQDTRSPLKFATIRVAAAACLGLGVVFALRPLLGLTHVQAGAALCLASALPAWLEFLLLRGSLRARIGRFSPAARDTFSPWLAAGAAVAGALALSSVLGSLYPLLRGAILLGTFGALYLAASLALGIPAASSFLGRVRGFLPGRRG